MTTNTQQEEEGKNIVSGTKNRYLPVGGGGSRRVKDSRLPPPLQMQGKAPLREAKGKSLCLLPQGARLLLERQGSLGTPLWQVGLAIVPPPGGRAVLCGVSRPSPRAGGRSALSLPPAGRASAAGRAHLPLRQIEKLRRRRPPVMAARSCCR